jgi:hypothetical protein
MWLTYSFKMNYSCFRSQRLYPIPTNSVPEIQVHLWLLHLISGGVCPAAYLTRTTQHLTDSMWPCTFYSLVPFHGASLCNPMVILKSPYFSPWPLNAHRKAVCGLAILPLSTFQPVISCHLDHGSLLTGLPYIFSHLLFILPPELPFKNMYLVIFDNLCLWKIHHEKVIIK